MVLSRVECSECSHGVVTFDAETKKFICNKCGALYEEED